MTLYDNPEDYANDLDYQIAGARATIAKVSQFIGSDEFLKLYSDGLREVFLTHLKRVSENLVALYKTRGSER